MTRLYEAAEKGNYEDVVKFLAEGNLVQTL